MARPMGRRGAGLPEIGAARTFVHDASNPGVAMKLLDETEIRSGLDGLEGWTREGDSIRKTYTLATFPEAIGFVSRIAELAEAVDHHPDIDIRFNRVALTISTHSAGGLTRRDFDLAARIDADR